MVAGHWDRRRRLQPLRTLSCFAAFLHFVDPLVEFLRSLSWSQGHEAVVFRLEPLGDDRNEDRRHLFEHLASLFRRYALKLLGMSLRMALSLSVEEGWAAAAFSSATNLSSAVLKPAEPKHRDQQGANGRDSHPPIMLRFHFQSSC